MSHSNHWFAAALVSAQGQETMFLIEGHTDSVGSDEANRQLSKERAEAVHHYLVSRGLPAQRLRVVPRGESRPLVANDTAENRANNRRVEIRISR